MALQRIAGGLEVDVLGQDDRELVLRHRNRAAFRAMDDRDRRAPVTLARDAPVAQPPDGRAFAPAVLLGAADHLGLGRFDVQPVEETRIDQHAVAALGLAEDRPVRLLGAGRDHALDFEAVFLGEFVIALVVRRDAENRAGAVVHQHEIRDEDRQRPIGIERMDDLGDLQAEFLRGLELGGGGAALLAAGDELGDLGRCACVRRASG